MAYYKILRCLTLVLLLIEFSLAESSSNPTFSNHLTPKAKLLNYYEGELVKIYQEFAEKSKNLSEHLLKDDKIQHANTTTLMEFKNIFTEYLNQYESLVGNGQFRDLVLLFSSITWDYDDESTQSDEDFVYILKLLKKLGFDEINNDYEQHLNELFDKKLLEQFEKLKLSYQEGELEKDQHLNDWYNLIKTCTESECYNEAYHKFFEITLTLKRDLYDLIVTFLKDLYISYGDKAKNISEQILKDDSLKDINITEIQDFKNNLTEFSSKYNSNQNVYELFNATTLYSNIISKYNETSNEKLKTVLKKFQTDELENDLKSKYMEYIDRQFIPAFEEYKLRLNEEELLRDKTLLDWYEQFKSRKTFEERKQAFNSFTEIFWKADENDADEKEIENN